MLLSCFDFNQEGESNEIVLKDDDATAIEKMFEFIYSRRLAPMDDVLEGMELVWLAINIYQVADKYDVPDLLELAPQILKTYLENWADLCLGDCICDDEYRIEVNENIMKDFGEIVQRVYAVTGGKTSCSFREALVNTTQTYDQFRITEPRGPFSRLAVHAAKSCHEFGKDMFLSLMEYSSLVIAS
jgi:hypothetical protein